MPDPLWTLLSLILGWIVPKDDRRAVFCGRQYGGNTAPLYEQCGRVGLRGSWLTRDPGQLPFPGAISTRSLAGVWALARAGHVVLTHALGDLAPLRVHRSTRIWNVWHGMPIKRISRADPRFWQRGYAKANVREQARYSGMFVTSRRMAEIFAETFGQPLERVHVTGQPRTDILVSEFESPSAKWLDGLPPHRRRILYCPTWREDVATRLLPFDDRDVEALGRALADLDAVMFVRLHPNEFAGGAPLFAGGAGRIVPLQGDVVPEVTNVLPAFDVLITDYSSVYYDFLMLDRPTIFLPYDLAEYAESPGFYISFANIAAGPSPSSQAEFVAALREAIDEPGVWAQQRRRVAAMVYERIDGGATQRVLEQITKPRRSA